MSTEAHIAHQTPGRVRIAIPSRRGDAGYFATLSGQLCQYATVRHVRVNAAAASVVLEFTGPLSALLPALQRASLAIVAPGHRGPAAVLHGLPVGLAAWSSSPMLLAGGAFALIGVVQTLRGEIFMPALTAFWYASNAVRLARLPGVLLPGKTAAVSS